MICYVTFTIPGGKEYAYFCGKLKPKAGDLVVVPVGKDNSLKIVSVSNVIDHHNPLANKEIFGIIVQQPKEEPKT